MPDYTLKLLYRFSEIDDAEARATMQAILSGSGNLLTPAPEHTLRRRDKVVASGTSAPKEPPSPNDEMHLKYVERQSERRKLKLIDIRDNLKIDRTPHALASSVKFLIEEIDAFLAEEVCPGEGPLDKCPDCGEPWWTVQKRCKCWPKDK